MTLTVTIGAGVALAIFALAGALRDLPRGIVVLAGVLLGAALVNFWAGPIAADLGQRLGNPDRTLLRRFASILIFSLATLFSFGSGLLLPKINGSTLLTRFGGTLIGLFSGALAVGYLLRYSAEENPTLLAEVRASPIGAPLHDQLALILAGGAVVISVAVVVSLLLRLFAGRAPAAQPAAQPQSNPGAIPNQSGRVTTQAVVEKIDQRAKP